MLYVRMLDAVAPGFVGAVEQGLRSSVPERRQAPRRCHVLPLPCYVGLVQILTGQMPVNGPHHGHIFLFRQQIGVPEGPVEVLEPLLPRLLFFPVLLSQIITSLLSSMAPYNLLQTRVVKIKKRFSGTPIAPVDKRLVCSFLISPWLEQPSARRPSSVRLLCRNRDVGWVFGVSLRYSPLRR